MSAVGTLKRGLAAGALLTALVSPALLPTAASAAEQDGILVSQDGEHYAKSLAGSLFAGELALVPGSTSTQTFHVRNDSTHAGELRIAVTDATASRVTFVESLSMSARTPSSDGSGAIRLRAGDACTSLFAGEILEPGDSTAVTITLAMDPSVSNAEQGATAGADLRVSIRQPGMSAADAFDCTAGTGIPVTDLTPETPGDPDKSGSTSTDDTGTTDGTGFSEDSDGAAQPGDTTAPPAAPSAPSVPATDAPGALAAPASGAQTAFFPWIGVGALAIGGVAFFFLRRRNQRAD